MKTITVTLDDKTAQKLESRAGEEGLGLDVFLSKAVEHNVDKLLRPRRWMPREKWAKNSVDYSIKNGLNGR